MLPSDKTHTHNKIILYKHLIWCASMPFQPLYILYAIFCFRHCLNLSLNQPYNHIPHTIAKLPEDQSLFCQCLGVLSAPQSTRNGPVIVPNLTYL